MLRSLQITFWMTLLGKVLGFLRIRQLATELGATVEVDAFFVAFSLVMLWDVMAITGAVGPTFIKQYVSHPLESRSSEKRRLTSTTFTAALFLSGVVSALLFLAAPLLPSLLVPGIRSPESREFVVQVIRILSVAPICIALVEFPTFIQQAHGRFFLSTANPLLINGFQLAFLYGATRLGLAGNEMILGLAVSLLLGYVAAAALQWSTVPLRPSLAPISWSANSLHAFGMCAAIALTAGIDELSTIANQAFASSVSEGAVATLGYATRLGKLLASLVISSVITVFYPRISQLIGAEDRGPFVRQMQSLFIGLLFVLLPAVVFMMLSAENLLGILYGREGFSAEAFRDLVLCFSLFLPSMLFQAWSMLITRSLYALGRARSVLIVNIVLLALLFAVNSVTVRRFGVVGITMTTTLLSVIQAGALLFLLQRDASTLFQRSWMLRAAGICVAGLISCVAVLTYTPPLGHPVFELVYNAVVIGCTFLLASQLFGAQAFALLRSVRHGEV